ncbi:MAG TPA: hypothetical protein VGU71_21070 [Candidatus Dormibacteraeota bacterium]|nr:hypothetical protein [Candidatus Dormibacteraeota bacterium]
MSSEERLAELISLVMRGCRPMTASEIARAIRRRVKVKTDERSVTRILMVHPRHFMRSRRRFFQRSSRWELVEVGPADLPGPAGAPVPAWPYRPTLSGAAAANLTFREDEPPANAIGKFA